MKGAKPIFCFFVSFVCLNHVGCQETGNVRNILNEIFETQKYDKRIRPVRNESRSISVSVSLFISGMNYLDEKTGVFSVTGFLWVTWRDEFLVWEPKLYNNVSSFTIPQDSIWMPDLFLRNGVKEPTGLGGDFYYLPVKYTGEVTWWPYSVFEARCKVDVAYFPFDTQICRLVFSIWNHDNKTVNIIKTDRYVDLYHFFENGIWSIAENKSYLELDEGALFNQLKVSFTLKRKHQFHLWNLIFPVILLGFLKIFAFLIPAQSGEKVSFAVTVFLSYGVFLNLLTSSLPENSDSVCLICAYIVIQLTLGVLLVFIVSMQVHICNREKNLLFSRYEMRLIRLLKKNSLEEFNRRHDETDTDWTVLSSAIDKLMLILMTAFEFFLIIVFSVMFYVNA
ncbi:neuronal acetylcholine receptor subunit non-alpha-2-like [Crassostrea angulata]|uniref:neuronal acetylcholine receptor subunit non-alpha-2-like n=1 Tax=Magallana angulata TaxID=2784310 RepID=UPI0022B153BB|nr:neuronal acetylcholine receptor subunit non-alpha-2-like [Crassostrea angulata]